MKKSLLFILALLAFLPGMLSAQTEKAPAVILAYVEDPSLVTLIDDAGKTQVANEGMKLGANWQVKTGKGGSAELQIKPNGSIIKISANTVFKINSLAIAGDAKTTNDFTIAAGKIRAVAAKLTGAGGEPGYTLKTPTANCGVRGTDFAINVDPENLKEWLCVQEGRVDFTKDATGEVLEVGAGMFADALADVFEVATVDQAQLDELFSDLGFIRLDPAEVAKIVNQAIADAVAADTNVAGDTSGADGSTKEAKTEEPPKPEDPLMAWLKKILGMEIGSVTIAGKSYSKVVASPVIRLDGFAMGLYLPVIYTTDMFDPSTWYRPAGNDEWSFGTDKTELLDKGLDILSDLALKIKFLEMGRQGVDPFYLKIGNLRTMTIGHGSIMSAFANDQEFPSVRKVGLNMGVTFGPIGLEGVADDLASTQVVGGRFTLALMGQFLPLSVSAIADLALVDPKGSVKAADVGDPILIVGGVDTQLFNLDLGILRAQLFADANVLTAYYRSAYGSIAAGTLATQTVLDTAGTLHSYGVEAGLQGKVLIVDYRLSFQMENGLYKNGMFRSNYYRTRADKLTSLNQYLTDAAYKKSVDEAQTIGVFGSAGFDLFGLLKFEGSYRYPMKMDAKGTISASADDSLKLGLELPKGALPDFIKLSGNVSYERTKFVDALLNNINLFDKNTVLRGEVLYGLAQGVDLAIGISTTVARDDAGNILYNDPTTKKDQKIIPSINLETRIGF